MSDNREVIEQKIAERLLRQKDTPIDDWWKLEPSLEKVFRAAYPELFPEAGHGYCGFSCGWGWAPILLNLCEELRKQEIEGKILQVKEKFGGLRFYFTNERAESLIRSAENLSLTTCEFCGAEGHTQDRRWIKTLCDDCERKRNPNEPGQIRTA